MAKPNHSRPEKNEAHTIGSTLGEVITDALSIPMVVLLVALLMWLFLPITIVFLAGLTVALIVMSIKRALRG